MVRGLKVINPAPLWNIGRVSGASSPRKRYLSLKAEEKSGVKSNPDRGAISLRSPVIGCKGGLVRLAGLLNTETLARI